MTDDLTPFFTPKTVAVVGASAREEAVGHALLKNLLFGEMHGSDRSKGFGGKVFAVNHKGGEILGQPVKKSLTEIGEPIDLVMIAIPPKYVKGVVEEAGGLGTKAVIVITAGFAEMGADGKALQDSIVEVAKGYGMRVIGPNCLGVIRPENQLNASFGNSSPPPGHIGLLSQSGALVTGMISYAQREKFGLSAAVSLGAKCDVDDQDILRWFDADPETTAIALYVEALHDPERFLEVAREVGAKTPIVAIKGGTTAAGAKAASSHTGSLAGAAAAYTAAFAQAGVLQAHSLGELSAWSRALAHQPPAKGKRIAIVTNAGGPGVLAAGRVCEARARARDAHRRHDEGARRGPPRRVVAQQPRRRDRRRDARALPRRAEDPRRRRRGRRRGVDHDRAGDDRAGGDRERDHRGAEELAQAAPRELHRPDRHRGGLRARRPRDPGVQHARARGERDGRARPPRRVARPRGREARRRARPRRAAPRRGGGAGGRGQGGGGGQHRSRQGAPDPRGGGHPLQPLRHRARRGGGDRGRRGHRLPRSS